VLRCYLIYLTSCLSLETDESTIICMIFGLINKLNYDIDDDTGGTRTAGSLVSSVVSAPLRHTRMST